MSLANFIPLILSGRYLCKALKMQSLVLEKPLKTKLKLRYVIHHRHYMSFVPSPDTTAHYHPSKIFPYMISYIFVLSSRRFMHDFWRVWVGVKPRENVKRSSSAQQRRTTKERKSVGMRRGIKGKCTFVNDCATTIPCIPFSFLPFFTSAPCFTPCHPLTAKGLSNLCTRIHIT